MLAFRFERWQLKTKIMIDELDYFNTDEIVCPYCGNVNSDSWELLQSGDVMCDKCENQFHVEIEEIRKYTSKPYDEEIERGQNEA